MNDNILEEFKKYGYKASYHYADDSAKEWGLGRQQKELALALFDENEELHDEMRKISKDFLWSLKAERPI